MICSKRFVIERAVKLAGRWKKKRRKKCSTQIMIIITKMFSVSDFFVLVLFCQPVKASSLKRERHAVCIPFHVTFTLR